MNVGRARRRAGLAITAGIVVLAVAGYAGFELAGQATRPSGPPQAAAPRPAPGRPAAASATPTMPATSGTSTTKASSAPPAPKTTPVTPTPQPTLLTPVKAESFGPDGAADGDNPQLAPNVLTDQAVGWRTHWYASSAFGRLKSGTGLLLDMGAPVTVTGVNVRLGSSPGADLELRLSPGPAPAAFQTVATTTATSSTANLAPAAPERARYVLLWCTRLPPSGTGTYQLLVHGVTVLGRR